MFVALLLTTTLLLAAVACRLVWRSFRYPISEAWPLLFVAAALSCFVYLYGAWIYLSAYCRYVFAAAIISIAVISLMRRRLHSADHRPRHRAANLIAGSLLLLLVMLYFTGTTGKPAYARLRFPMSKGEYFVLQGGKGLPANAAHFSSRGAVYAMDIVKLDRWGRRCTQVFSTKLDDYYIFGDTVFAPCDGLIQRAVSDNPDNVPPHRERGPHNLNGVVIDGADYTVFLGHLQQDRVFVSAGQQVVAGQALGLAGNSGMSIEPHLHIQVHAKSPDGGPWYRQPQLFILFDDEEYLLFEEIDAR